MVGTFVVAEIAKKEDEEASQTRAVQNWLVDAVQELQILAAPALVVAALIFFFRDMEVFWCPVGQ